MKKPVDLGQALNNYLQTDPIFAEEVKKLAPHWFVDTVAENKKELLGMAKRGEQRPKEDGENHKIARSLGRYTNDNNKMYDPVFDAEIRRLVPSWFVDTAAENKKLLIEMARRGEPRPNKHKEKLGILLQNYISKNVRGYDPVFDIEIRKLAPQWFINTAVDKKKELLEMAKSGESRPSTRNTLSRRIGLALCHYTNKGSTYDVVFDEKIRKLVPHWFVDTAAENKKLLIEMARKGEPRPNGRTKLGMVFQTYKNKNSRCYDQAFDEEIRKLAPQWFVNTAVDKKKELLEMARKGEPRPNSKTKIGNALLSYMDKTGSCYDPVFDNEIRKLAPHWFIDTAAENKKLLLEMAMNGESRPIYATQIGGALWRYVKINSKCYDEEFKKQIYGLAPLWFIDTVSENKKSLLKMAEKGEQRPKLRSLTLGSCLVQYTCKTSGSYDPVFDKEIRKLALHWFVKKGR